MKFKIKSAPKQEVPATVRASLADQIREAQKAAAQVVEAQAQKIKASEEGRQLPLDWIRMNIRALARAGSCDCKCALSLLEDQH
jgi:hypothetical protein